MTKSEFIKNVASELSVMVIDDDLYLIDKDARMDEAERLYNSFVNIIKISSIKGLIITAHKVVEREITFTEHINIILRYDEYRDIRLNEVVCFSKNEAKLI